MTSSNKTNNQYHYEWLYHSEDDLIPIEVKDNDKTAVEHTETE